MYTTVISILFVFSIGSILFALSSNNSKTTVISAKFKIIYLRLYRFFLRVVGFSRDRTSRNLYRLFVFAIYATLTVFLINLLSLFGNSSFGTWGDFFGGVLNPILTFLTFMGLLITIILQQSELKEPRKEFKRSADALLEQSRSIKKQNFENTFFNLIDLHNKITDNLKIDAGEFASGGFFTSGIKEFLNGITEAISSIELGLNRDEKRVFYGREVFEFILHLIIYKSLFPKNVVDRYKVIQNNKNHILGHYFRNLYQVLKLIDTTSKEILTKKQKRKYSGIIRAQLSSKELAILSINCLDEISDEGEFKNLLIKYSMLEHLPLTPMPVVLQRENPKDNAKYYGLSGTNEPILDESMLLQYKKKKKISGKVSSNFYGGAFGENKLNYFSD